MYTIGKIVYGVPMPWDVQQQRDIAALHATSDPIAAAWLDLWNETLGEGEEELTSGTDLIEFIKQGDIDDVMLEWLEEYGWEAGYHGGADAKPAWCGVVVGEIDETDHMLVADIPTATDEQRAEAEAKYNALPQPVRDALTPIGLYIVWCSS